MIPYFSPDMPSTEELIPYLKKIDHNQWYSNFGPLFTKLKESIAIKCLDSIHCDRITLVSSGTSAIELALKHLKLPANSKVLTSCFTFPATIEAIICAGLTPVICDIDTENWQLTPAMAEQALSHCDVAAVLPVAAFGIPVCSESWANFSQKTGLPVVVDAAPALLNQDIHDQLVYAFSLHATKPIGAGEGGLVVCPSKVQAVNIQKMSNFGIEPDRTIGHIGTNAKLSEYHCAVGLANLDRLDSILTKRKQLFRYYRHLLADKDIPLKLQAGCEDFTPASFYVVFDDANAASVEAALLKRNIETRRLYAPLINAHPAFKDIEVLSNSALENALRISENGLALPFHMKLNHDDISRVVDTLAEIL